MSEPALLDEALSARILRLYDAAIDSTQGSGIAPTIADAFQSTSTVLILAKAGTHRQAEAAAVVTRALVTGDVGKPVLNYWVGMENSAMRVAADAKSSAVVQQDVAARQCQEHQTAAGNKPRL